jgi:hypothetical protein
LVISAGAVGSPDHANAPPAIESANQMSAIAMCVAICHAVRDFGSGL